MGVVYEDLLNQQVNSYSHRQALLLRAGPEIGKKRNPSQFFIPLAMNRLPHLNQVELVLFFKPSRELLTALGKGPSSAI